MNTDADNYYLPDWRAVTEAMAKDPQHPDWERYFNAESTAVEEALAEDLRAVTSTLEMEESLVCDLESDLALSEETIKTLTLQVEALQRELAFYKREHPLETK